MGQTLILARFTEKLEEKTLDHLNYYLNFAFQLMDRIDHTAVFLCQLPQQFRCGDAPSMQYFTKGCCAVPQPVQAQIITDAL